MPIQDMQGRDRPERKAWVYKDFTVKEETVYGSNDEEYKDQWYVLGVGNCKIGDGAFDTREEAVAYGKRQLTHQIGSLQRYLDALE
jgi:hypothetical protein